MKNPVKNIISRIKNLGNKKILIVISVLLLTGTISIIFVTKRNKKKTPIKSEFSFTRTVTLGYSSLQDTVVASGTIESQSTSTITSSVNNATISKINYSIGDYVNEGDVIIELDTTNINKQITKIEDSLQEKYDNAVASKDEAWGSWSNAKQTYDAANTAFTSAKNSVSYYQNLYDDAEQAKKNEADACYAALGNTCDLNTYGNYTTLKTEADEAKTNLENIKKSVNYDELEKAYNSSKEAYTKAENNLSQANSNVANAEENLNGEGSNDDLEELYDTVSNYQLKAKSTGQITNINAVLGSNANGTLATIQDTTKLKISLTIDEYDILKLSLGMKAVIDTDASDKTYEGEVSQISPVASSSMDSSGFEIEVKITSEDVSELLIGMNAEVTIIIEETSKNFNVPIDAIENKQDGSKVIYVQNDKGEFDELIVTTGETNGYYIEIFSDELMEGMTVRASANADEAKINTFDDEQKQEESGFDFGRFGSGGMPSNREFPSDNRRSFGGFNGGPGGFN